MKPLLIHRENVAQLTDKNVLKTQKVCYDPQDDNIAITHVEDC